MFRLNASSKYIWVVNTMYCWPRYDCVVGPEPLKELPRQLTPEERAHYEALAKLAGGKSSAA